MKWSALLTVFLSLAACAKERPWQDAKVVGQNTEGAYWVRASENTYILRPAKVNLVLGGKIRAYADGKALHVVDVEGKDRKCQIQQVMTNEVADAMIERERAKTPDQRAAEHAAYIEQIQRQKELQMQVLREWNAQHTNQPIQVEVKDCTKYPALCTH